MLDQMSLPMILPIIPLALTENVAVSEMRESD